MKKDKNKSMPANQSSSKKGADFGVRQNDAKARENSTKHTLRK